MEINQSSVNFPICLGKKDKETKMKRNVTVNRTLMVMAILSILACIVYMTLNVNFANEKLFTYSMKIRTPKMVVMVIAAFSIGCATIVFQSIINSRIITPCLLGMNSLYTLINTMIAFFLGTSSIIFLNDTIAYAVNLVLMCLMATTMYSYLFKKTKYNVLYVMLVGIVLTSLFSSMQSAMVRIMDPNEYDTLLNTLVASFSNIKTEIIAFSVILLVVIGLWLRRELGLLDVLTLGKDQAINLGVDYDKTIRKLLLGVTLYIAVATALVGPISFLGLIIANLARQFLTTYKHTKLMMASTFFGVIVLVGGQIAVEHVFNYAIPVSVFITLGGGIYFLYLLLANKS